MQLPGDELGISDILQWRSCPAKFAHQMRRHATLPDGRKDEPPGSTNWTNAFGSAIHHGIHLVETEGLSNDEAITVVWKTYGGYLDPEDLALLTEDLDHYRGDTPLGMELVASEANVRVPLFVHDGVQMYFRFTLDSLYRRTQDPTAFYHRDFKSSKWRKTQADVDKDLQMWAYNFGIFEMYPEARSLVQSYEQLRFGNLNTGKNAEQRSQMKRWLIETVTAILGDEKLEPKQEPFCPYCPLVVTCDVTKRSTDYWKSRLDTLAPREKDGRKTVIAFSEEGQDLDHMISEVLPRMIESRKHMEAVEKALKEIIEQMPSEERAALGWRLSDRKTRVLSPEGLRDLHGVMGDSFYEVVSLAKAAAEREADDAAKQLIKERELEQVSTTTVVPVD